KAMDNILCVYDRLKPCPPFQCLGAADSRPGFGCDDGDGGVIVEFQLAGADYPLAGSQSLFNHHQAVATFARGNETTLDTLAWLALFVGLYLAGLILLIRDDIERVAVKAISDGGFRYHHALRRLGQQ